MANKQNTFLVIIVSAILCLLISCAPYKPVGYYTMTQNVPLLSEKYELQAMGTAGLNHVEGQIAFAPTEQIGLIGNFWKNTKETDGYCVEGGIGYHKNFAKNGILEVYGIFTNATNNGHVYDHNGTGELLKAEFYTHDLNVDYKGYSLQFNIGKKLPRKEIGMSLSYGLMEYSHFYYHYKKEIAYSYVLLDSTYYLDNKTQQFLTIAPTVKFGWTNFKFLAQISYRIGLSKTHGQSPSDTPPFYSPEQISIGFVYDLFFHKKKEAENEINFKEIK